MFNRFFQASKRGDPTLSASMMSLYGPTFTPVKANFRSITSSASNLICVGGASMQASVLQAINQKIIDNSKKITIIGGRSWLADVHQDWYDKPWGQDIRYLPDPLVQIVKDLYRDYPDNKIMNFGMMKRVVFELENRLQETGIVLINKEVYDLQEKDDGIYGNFKDGTKARLGDRDYRVINVAIQPKSLNNLPANHPGKLYHVSQSESSETIAFIGSGANLTWGCRDLQQFRKIIHLQPVFDREREDLSDILHQRIFLDDQTKIEQGNGLITIYGIDLLSKQRTVITLPESMVFSALGHQHNDEITSRLNKERVVNVNCGPSSQNIVNYHSVARGEKSVVATDYRGTVVPPGNLKYNYLKINANAGNFRPSDRNALIVFEEWEKALLESAIAHNIVIEPAFFHALKSLAKGMYTNQVHKHESIIKAIEVNYVKLGMPARFINSSNLTAEQFMRLVNGTLTEYLYDTHHPARSYTDPFDVNLSSIVEELSEDEDNTNDEEDDLSTSHNLNP